MLNKQTINKLNKLHEEALDNLTNKQVSLLMQKITEDLLKDFNNEKATKFENLIKYFMEQDIYITYSSLYGIFQGVDIIRMSLSVELGTANINNFIQMNNTAINEFNTNFKALKYFLSKIYKYSNNPEIVKELNELIEVFYLNMWFAKEDADVEIIVKHKEEIEKRNKYIRELINEYEDLYFDDINISSLELNLKLFFNRLEEYYKNLEEFETMSEDGFIFLKEKDPTHSKLNLFYDFTQCEIKKTVKNES